MSLYPILWAVDHAPVRDAEERAILVALVIKGDFDGCNCFRSYKTLAGKAMVDPKTAGRRCRDMEKRGLLKRQEEHRSKAWLAIPEEQRPVIWEVMIPAEWWSPAQLADINEQRAGLGRPPLTPVNRPALAPAPPKKSRADKGTKRPKNVDQSSDPGTTSPWGTPGTDSPHPRDSQSPPPGLVVPQPSESPSETHSENKTAPSARSAADVRRTSAGSSARGDASGYAAAEKIPSAADDVAGTQDDHVPGPQDAAGPDSQAEADGPSDGQRHPAKRGRTGRGSSSPFPLDVRQRIYTTEALLPAPLRDLLAEKFPYGHLPNSTRQVTAQALETRTPEQLGERATRRWAHHGYERDHFDGLLRSPLGVVEALLRPTPYCPDPECEDGANLHTGQPCVPCGQRNTQRARDRAAGRAVPTQRPPRIQQDRAECEVCQRPLPEAAPADVPCTQCRAEMDRATAFLTGAPLEETVPVPDDHPDAAYRPTGPTDAYLQARASAGPAPF